VTLVHNTLLHTGTDLRNAIDRGIEKLEANGQMRDEDTRKAVVDELSRMRSDLRETKNRMVSSLSEEVRQAITSLKMEVRAVASAVDDLAEVSTAQETPAGLGPAQASTSGLSGSDDTMVGPQEPSGSESNAQFQTPPAVHPCEESGAVESSAASTLTEAVPAPKETGALSIPTPRNGGANEALEGPTVAEQVQEAVRAALTEGLAGLPMSATAPSGVVAAPADIAMTVRDEVRTALNSFAEELREHLNSAREEWQADLNEIRRETATMVEAVREVKDVPATEGEEEVTKEHSELLRQAARVSSTVLVCHRDTWGFITARASRHPHFRVPPQVADTGHERMRANISGRSLIALLISLFSVKSASQMGDGDHELASTIYQRIRDSLTTLDGDGRPVTIVLDDRTPVPADVASAAEEGAASHVTVDQVNSKDDASDQDEPSEEPGPEVAN
jgi:archaellum component FlaC